MFRTIDSETRIQIRTLHGIERSLNPRSIDELIRLLDSECFEQLTSDQIRALGDYRAIEVGGESFFERAFSTGKEVASSLAIARELGRTRVLDDLRALRVSLQGSEAFGG